MGANYSFKVEDAIYNYLLTILKVESKDSEDSDKYDFDTPFLKEVFQATAKLLEEKGYEIRDPWADEIPQHELVNGEYDCNEEDEDDDSEEYD